MWGGRRAHGFTPHAQVRHPSNDSGYLQPDFRPKTVETNLDTDRTKSSSPYALLTSAPVRWRRESRRAPLLIMLAGLAVGLLVPGSGGADPAQQANTLRGKQATLTARSHAALLSLYSLDTQLARARARLSALQAQAATLRAQQLLAKREQAIAQDAWRKTAAALGNHLRAIYEQGEPDAISRPSSGTHVAPSRATTRSKPWHRPARRSKRSRVCATSSSFARNVWQDSRRRRCRLQPCWPRHARSALRISPHLVVSAR